MAFELPPLPYPENALEPHISARTMSLHHGKHHRGYVDKLNKAVAGSPFEGLENKDLERIITETAQDAERIGIFNNAAQAWNHTFFWNSMTREGGGAPDGELGGRLDDAFGGFAAFKQAFRDAATGHFGSGWAWLVLDRDRLKVISTQNAVPPMIYGQYPLLTLDLWEHAYYLDYQNRKGDFFAAFLDHLVNWDFVASRLTGAGEEPPREARGRPRAQPAG